MIGTIIVIGVILVAAAVGGILIYKKNPTKVDAVISAAETGTTKVVEAGKTVVVDVKKL
jgi:hypothetical protein